MMNSKLSLLKGIGYMPRFSKVPPIQQNGSNTANGQLSLFTSGRSDEDAETAVLPVHATELKSPPSSAKTESPSPTTRNQGTSLKDNSVNRSSIINREFAEKSEQSSTKAAY